MKKGIAAVMAGGLILTMSGSAGAIDFKIKGYISNSVDVATNNNFANSKAGEKNDDQFSTGERIRLQLDAVASKSLSGVVYFEIGDIYYGNAESGGALGADASNLVEVKRAFLDWRMPGTDLKVRMGIQGMKLPLYASSGNFVLDDDAAGIVAPGVSTTMWPSPACGAGCSTTTSFSTVARWHTPARSTSSMATRGTSAM